MAAPSKQSQIDTSTELMEAVEDGQWREVLWLIHSSDCSHEQRCWAIEMILKDAPEERINDVCDNCTGEALDSVLSHLLTAHLWRGVGRVLQRDVGRTQHRWVIEQASRHADNGDFVDFILPHCDEEDLESVTSHLVSRGLWEAVSKVLERGVSFTQRRWAVEEALEHADEWTFAFLLLPHCRKEELEQALTQAVSQGLWLAVSRILQLNISGAKHKWAVEQASRHAGDAAFVFYILPHCDKEDLECVITHLISRGMWDSVIKALERGVSSTQRRWAVEQASRHADERKFADYILPCCKEEELEQVLTHMASRGLWKPVDSVTDRDVSIPQHILTQLVSRGLWFAVGRFLRRHLCIEVQRWVVDQAVRHKDQWEFADDREPHYETPRYGLSEMLTGKILSGQWEPVDSVSDSDVTVAQHILSQLISYGRWTAVARFLWQGVSHVVRRYAVEQASRYADDDSFFHYILPHCHEAELESVITCLVSRGLWKSVGSVLGRGVNSTKHRWAVEQAGRHAAGGDFDRHILPHCHGQQLESVVVHLVLRDLWTSVGQVLQKTSHSIQLRWVIEQASKCADDRDFVDYILPHCHDELEFLAITKLVSRGLWMSVGKLLQRNISTTQRRRILEHTSRCVGDDDFVRYILPYCHNGELDSVITYLVSRGLCLSVAKVLQRGLSSTQHSPVLVEAAKHVDDSSFHQHLLNQCSEDDVVAVFPHLVRNKMWKCAQQVLWVAVRDTLYLWMTLQDFSGKGDALFWKFIHSCHVDISLALGLTKAVTHQIKHKASSCGKCKECFSDVSSRVIQCIPWQETLCELLMISLLHVLCEVVCSEDRKYTDNNEHTRQCVSDIYTWITACVQDNKNCVQDNTLKSLQNKQEWTSVFTELADLHSNDPLFLLHFLQRLNLYHISRSGESDDAVLLVLLAVFPLFPQLQSVALRIMLREKRWDVISQACLSHVWEHDWRRLFKAAVMQRQWDVVRQWCDHRVHDDQRHWALTEAFKEKQWEVFLLLADHGLTPAEHMCVHYRLAKHGDWETVLDMVERGGDITEVSNLLEQWVTGNLRKKPEGDVTMYEARCMKLIRLRLRFAQKAALSPRKALERCMWGSVLFNILHEPTQRYFSQVVEKVREEQKWHILMHLVRLGMTSADRDRLFPDMVRQRQWGVCRMLLEYGVSDCLCLEALPELMERNQWTLVAVVMEYEVDDAVRRQVMHLALQRRAGALFWHCLATLKDQEHLSKETQEKLFHQAISREIWQAVKPLVKEKDGPDVQRRDMAFLEAIEQHLWDVVDYCQPLGADINMKDENGETPLNREARKKEWKAVEEIVLRDGQPNLLDQEGVSVLNRLIDYEQWDIVKVVITYGGDIHLSAKCSDRWLFRGGRHTPLQALITARQADVIHFTIKWCGDQDKGANNKGERVLHAVCDSDRWDVMRDLIDIKVNPLAVTKTGKSPLAYAVLNTKCGKRMVAECSRQGFTTYQPSVTGPLRSLCHHVGRTVPGFSESWASRCDYIRWESEITSPLVCALLCDLTVVAFMLYESGSCSNLELFTLYTELPKLTDLDSMEGRKLQDEINRKVNRTKACDDWLERRSADCLLQNYSRLMHTLKQGTPLLRELATTPRTLLSSCRLRILQHFHFSDKYRLNEMSQLPLPVSMKEYLKFSDLCDPDYGGHML